MKSTDINRMYGLNKTTKYTSFTRTWYKADFYYADFEIITSWCTQQFGGAPTNSDAWSRWWHNGQDRVFFRDEQDYILYILRWQ